MSVIHIVERAKERYGVEITADDVTALARQISRGDAVLLERRPDGSEAYICRLDRLGVCFQALWRPNLTRIVTVIPADARRHRPGRRI